MTIYKAKNNLPVWCLVVLFNTQHGLLLWTIWTFCRIIAYFWWFKPIFKNVYTLFWNKIYTSEQRILNCINNIPDKYLLTCLFSCYAKHGVIFSKNWLRQMGLHFISYLSMLTSTILSRTLFVEIKILYQLI